MCMSVCSTALLAEASVTQLLSSTAVTKLESLATVGTFHTFTDSAVHFQMFSNFSIFLH